MSSYRFEIKNYHAVSKADIEINGITVLSGLNGSGKSTVARWLYLAVKIMNDFEQMVEKQGVNSFLSFLSDIRRVAISIDESGEFRKMNEIVDTAFSSGLTTMSDTIELFDKSKNTLIKVLENNINGKTFDQLIKRLSFYFNIDAHDIKTEKDLTDYVFSNLDTRYKSIIDSVREKINNRTVEEFSNKVSLLTDEDVDNDSVEIEFFEDGASLLTSDSFKMPINLHNVIYINTQNIGQALDKYSTGELSEMLVNNRVDTISAPAKAISKIIQDLIGGNVEAEKGRRTPSGTQKTYIFIGNDGSRFNLKGAATGIISFSYILQLIKNGWIDENTLLIIDEPECHLHPQWIVDYARILVLLQKMLGTKVLISSHNPDMVSAIESVANKEGILHLVNFYLSEPDAENDGKYVFTKLGQNCEKIFDSFNMAIDRINRYNEE